MSERARKELGERVRNLRERQGISQTTFASMIGMDRGYFIDIEKGRRNPTLDKIESIANGLDVSIAFLMKGVCESQQPSAPSGSYEYRTIHHKPGWRH
ncbi:MAG: helix-turn-helix transcriptional regulator [Eggerthellaceae bacterium]|nr:helix-turn-helix transcriptional regulator [Eggerthellaceae bacterium]